MNVKYFEFLRVSQTIALVILDDFVGILQVFYLFAKNIKNTREEDPGAKIIFQ
jgi:hypothetical protein